MNNFVSKRYKFIKYGLISLVIAIVLVVGAFAMVFVNFNDSSPGGPDITFGFLSVIPVLASFIFIAMGTLGMIINAITNNDPNKRNQDLIWSVIFVVGLTYFIVKALIPALS